MIVADIARARLHNQQLSRKAFDEPGDVVRWLGAVQAQDFAGAMWAVGQRIPGATEAGLERAFNDGSILRTHVMRPTWHFVAPSDIRWMLALTEPRVNALNSHYYRKLGLDKALFMRSNDLMADALQGGKYLTRPELMGVLGQAGIDTSDLLRCTYLVMSAELDAVICSGPRRGKQFTYALLDERAPQAVMLAKEEALAELTRGYFTSHGPATIQDFVWWSGLTTSDARVGLELARSRLSHELIDEQTYWVGASSPPSGETSPIAYLLPNYDEYTVGFADRSAVLDKAHTEKLDPRSGILSNVVVIDGMVAGTWKRTLKKDAVIVETSLFTPLSADETKALTDAAERYGQFLGLDVQIAWL